ncbi:2-C-methyl-D-erythritol 4-phosphate cytidylyltransferase [Thermodesulfatator autotrophicus]|uniref:2-C-methyl-D-erythritol 4-phosphate cytidylyltransferase n=1 Tax=Thermodesulfatator autotrophicus TaxID=1795632 RepID=A0A177E6A9_9BACT|nr:2-C-methyl-D-erythritol 4-phosphate cytidylyltransferase [Thermodesulfatator autotrophicus]OAG27487.1 hypothetical protein TH606_06660 [Thermodesulfatator autotrophicus]
MNAVIIPAGGIGSRVGEKIPKQFLEIAGKPLITYTLSLFENLKEIDLIVIPVLATWEERLKKLLERFRKPYLIVPGGETRQASVANGFFALPGDTEIVLVHDACRPFASPEVIRLVISKIRKKGAALAALPARDTIKEVVEQRVLKTLPRERIYLAHTPQGARYSLFQKALATAQEKNLLATDEASLLEAAGIPVYVVPSTPLNFKITTKEDFELAKCLLTARRP